MFEINPSPIEQYVFNQVQEKLVGGYPIVEYIKKENEKRRLLNNGADGEVGLSAFENLVIPAGLVSYSDAYFEKTIGGSQSSKMKPVKKLDDISEPEFEVLFASVSIIKPIKKSNAKTKKIAPK